MSWCQGTYNLSLPYPTPPVIANVMPTTMAGKPKIKVIWCFQKNTPVK